MLNGKLNVLLVEDEPVVCLIHQTYLESIGCNVIVAVNSDEALHHIMQPCDLVVMDIGLPGISGIEVVDIYRKQESKDKKLPIVFLTAYQDPEIAKKCLLVGGDAVFYKPITRDGLKQVVETYVAAK